MNIFHLHEDPKICAEYHCDKHVVKMILETAQMLSTAYRKKLDHTKEYAIEYVNKHNHFISTTTRGIEPK